MSKSKFVISPSTSRNKYDGFIVVEAKPKRKHIVEIMLKGENLLMGHIPFNGIFKNITNGGK